MEEPATPSGLVLRAIVNRDGLAGKIAAAIAGGVWSLVTMFVVPVMVFEEKGVVESMKESLALFRKIQGESVGATSRSAWRSSQSHMSGSSLSLHRCSPAVSQSL